MKTKNYESDHASEILSNLNKDRESDENFCDITLEAGTRDFSAHRCVLASFSSFYKTLLTIEMKEKYEDKVKLQHVDEETLDDILNFIYTSRVSLSNENVYKILEAANFMDITRLKEYCADFLWDEVDHQNCFSILEYAKMYNMEALLRKIDDVIKEKFEFIIKEEQFKELKFEEVLRIMQIKDKKISFQESVYHSLVDWIKNDVTSREKFLPNLFKLIELEKLSGDFLANVVGKESLVMSSNECTKMFLRLTLSRLATAEKTISDQKSLVKGITEATVSCRKVGMEDGRILDSQITASSSWSSYYEPKYGRLNKRLAPDNHGCWLSGSDGAAGEYIQIALEAPTRISGVITQGEPRDNGYFTTSYTIAYGNSTNTMQTIKDSSGKVKVFTGNTDATSQVTNMFPHPVTTSFIRLIIKTWNKFPAIRMELLTN